MIENHQDLLIQVIKIINFRMQTYIESKESKPEAKSIPCPDIEEQLQMNKKQRKLSSYQGQYNQFFSQTPGISITQYQSRLAQHKISYNQNRFCSELNIVVISQSISSQVVTLSVSFSFFCFDITLYNEDKKSCISEKRSIGQGGMGKIYTFAFQENLPVRSFVLKSINYNNANFIEKELRHIIKQCCFTKLFSALMIGPQFLAPFGFDLIAYPERAEFCIQECEKLNLMGHDQERTDDLKKSLKIMHNLNIVHGDIKIENIMYSKSYKKIVFIDFGLSKSISESIGEMSYTTFFGTFQYTVKQMRELYKSEEKNYVDLYYNDVNALIACITESSNAEAKKIRLASLDEFQKVQLSEEIRVKAERNETKENIMVKLAKFFIYQRNFEAIKELFEISLIQQPQEVLYFFVQIGSDNEVRNIFKAFIQAHNLTNNQLAIQIQKNLHLLNTHSFFNHIQQITKERKLEFSARVRSIVSSDRVPISNLMQIIKISCNQDISPKAEALKTKLQKYINSQLQKVINYKDKKLSKEDKVDQADTWSVINDFWSAFVKYIENLYTTKSQVEKMLVQGFQATISDHSFKSKQKKQEAIQKYKKFTLYERAIKLRSSVLLIFGIDLFKLSNQIYELRQKESLYELNVTKDSNMESQIWSIGRLVPKIKENVSINFEFQQKQLYQDFCQIFGEYNRFQKKGEYFLGKISQFKRIHKQKIQKNGLCLLLDFAQIYLESDRQKLTKQKISKFQSMLMKYTVSSKCRLSLELARLQVQEIFQSMNFQSAVQQFSFYSRLAFNYCFRLEVLIHELLRKAMLIKLINNKYKTNLLEIQSFFKFAESLTEGCNIPFIHSFVQMCFDNLIQVLEFQAKQVNNCVDADYQRAKSQRFSMFFDYFGPQTQICSLFDFEDNESDEIIAFTILKMFEYYNRIHIKSKVALQFQILFRMHMYFTKYYETIRKYYLGCEKLVQTLLQDLIYIRQAQINSTSQQNQSSETNKKVEYIKNVNIPLLYLIEFELRFVSDRISAVSFYRQITTIKSKHRNSIIEKFVNEMVEKNAIKFISVDVSIEQSLTDIIYNKDYQLLELYQIGNYHNILLYYHILVQKNSKLRPQFRAISQNIMRDLFQMSNLLSKAFAEKDSIQVVPYYVGCLKHMFLFFESYEVQYVISFFFNQFFSSQGKKSEKVKNFFLLPIIEQTLVLLTSQKVFLNISLTYITDKIGFLVRLAAKNVQNSVDFYRRRLSIKYWSIIRTYMSKGVYLPSSSLRKKLKNFQSMEKMVKFQIFRSQQFPLKEKELLQLLTRSKSSYDMFCYKRIQKLEKKIIEKLKMWNRNKQESLKKMAYAVNGRFHKIYADLLNENCINAYI